MKRRPVCYLTSAKIPPCLWGFMFRSIARIAFLILIAIPSLSLALLTKDSADPRLKNAFRAPAKNGWTYVHLEGSPSEIGFQHGYLLSAEIEDTLKVFTFETTHDKERLAVLPRCGPHHDVAAHRAGI